MMKIPQLFLISIPNCRKSINSDTIYLSKCNSNYIFILKDVFTTTTIQHQITQGKALSKDDAIS